MFKWLVVGTEVTKSGMNAHDQDDSAMIDCLDTW